jgi:hypothetical protein
VRIGVGIGGKDVTAPLQTKAPSDGDVHAYITGKEKEFSIWELEARI